MMKEKLKAEIKRVEALCTYLVQQRGVIFFKMTDDETLYTVDNIKEYSLSADEAKQLLCDNLDRAGISEEVKQKSLKQFDDGDIEKYGFIDNVMLLRMLAVTLKTLRKLDGK